MRTIQPKPSRYDWSELETTFARLHATVRREIERKQEEDRLLKGLQVAPLPTNKVQALKKHLLAVASEDPQRFARLVKVRIHEDDQ